MAEHTRRPSSDAARKSAEIGQRAATVAARKSVEIGQRAATDAVRKSVEIGQRAATDAVRKSVEIGQRAATDAARELVSALEGVTPAALADSERRKSIVDAAADWADWLVAAHTLFLGRIATQRERSAERGHRKASC